MNVRLDIDRRLKSQFERCFKLTEIDGDWYLDPSLGTGGAMKWLAFPGELEFYHFQRVRFATPIFMKSVNPTDSEWYLIHINLSDSRQRKFVDGKAIEFQKRLANGMLIYGPGLEIDTKIPPDVDMELASIRFNRQFLDTYFEDWRETVGIGKSLIHESLDYQLERKLATALESMHDKMQCHAAVLAFVGLVVDKLKAHGSHHNYTSLRPKEIEGLFRASALLRDPLATGVPSVAELAAVAHMGRTKFKSSFRQVFGSAPMQYRNRIRMEFAREEINVTGRTPTEISYLLGYSHPSNFTAAYKKHFGEVPSASQP